MAVTHYDLTATFTDLLGTAYSPTSAKVVAWIETNVASSEGIVDEVANSIALGGSRQVADSGGNVTWANLVGSDSAAADINLESGTLQYRVTAEYVDAITRRRKTWVSGWFSLTADIDLADVVAETYVPAAWMTTATATLQTYVDAGQAAATTAAAASTTASGAADTAVNAAGLASEIALGDADAAFGAAQLNPASPLSVAQGDVLDDPTHPLTVGLATTYASRAGGNEYHTATPVLGEVGWFPNVNSTLGPIIAAEDYILWQPFAKNSATIPRVWAENPVVVKDVKSPAATNPLAIGIEISASNNTDEANNPSPTGSNGALIGLYVSYINTVNQGSAAMYVTGIAAGTNIGWKHGLFLDGIATGGTGISLRNAVGTNAMGVGIDLSTHAGNFSIGAILLGNAHRILGKKTDGNARELIYINGANVMVIGDANTQDYTMRFFAQTYEFSGISTATTATAGARTLPAAPANFMPVTVAGTTYKIPLYNI